MEVKRHIAKQDFLIEVGRNSYGHIRTIFYVITPSELEI